MPQVLSKKRSAHSYGFGSEKRAADKPNGVPSPGTYMLASSVGKQALSNKQSSPVFHFSSGKRDIKYVSASPGPASYGGVVSVGKQVGPGCALCSEREGII